MGSLNHIKHLALTLLKTPTTTLRTPSDLKRLHVYLIKTHLHLTSSFAVGNLISRAASLGLLFHASTMFDQMPHPNVFVYNNLIRAFHLHHHPQNALLVFLRMNVVPDSFTFVATIKACVEDPAFFRMGASIHARSVRTGFDRDVPVATGLIEFYAARAGVDAARKVFDEMGSRDVVSWTTMLACYVNMSDDIASAREVFDAMPEKDVKAWGAMVGGYVKAGDMGRAREVFDEAPSRDLLMRNVMLGGYAKVGEVGELTRLFWGMRDRDVVSWNTVIGGLVQGGQFNDAVAVFHRMQVENARPNRVTFVNILLGCARVGALDVGRWIHSFIDRNGFIVDAVVGTALVDMYSKCGALESATHVFGRMAHKDVAAWNSMIMGYSMNGRGDKSLEFFHAMRGEGVEPNEVTMVGVLSSCAHAGMVEEGKRCFEMMRGELGIAPTTEHYGCVVDLLGRAGLLREAREFIQSMPVEPGTNVWGALLGACKIHKNVTLAELAVERLIELGVDDGGYLAIMSNIYANVGRWC
ncbi:putative pentatricopeptide repeat-containing protein [Acorus gramineus]|uniref:Pentatricopeptide repeat-containing protein n=1 Tax=Acorus gramineus TaxID=55184 RepID=A0AAV9ALV6_ACOGR|nr:putative pentatricopeptide repeat-containing protein [Acorus gramineus]